MGNKTDFSNTLLDNDKIIVKAAINFINK